MTGEGDIWSSSNNVNIEKFEVIVETYQTILLRITLRFVKDLAVAEDVVQEAFIKAYEGLSKFEGRSSLKTWLIQIAINTAKNKLRKRNFEDIENHSAHLYVDAGIVEGMEAQSLSKKMREVVDQLPAKQKMALVLRVYEDLSFQEICEIMKCPYDTAKANYRHGLLKIKELLKGDPEISLMFESNFNTHQKEIAV